MRWRRQLRQHMAQTHHKLPAMLLQALGLSTLLLHLGRPALNLGIRGALLATPVNVRLPCLQLYRWFHRAPHSKGLRQGKTLLSGPTLRARRLTPTSLIQRRSNSARLSSRRRRLLWTSPNSAFWDSWLVQRCARVRLSQRTFSTRAEV